MKNNSSSLHSLNKALHACIVCGIEFEGSKAAKYCSNACRQKAKHQRNKDGVIARPDARIKKIRMTPEDVANIDSIYSLIQRISEKKFDLSIIVENYRSLLPAFEETLKNINDELKKDIE